MSDIVERLLNENYLWTVPGALRKEAAAEIERLRATLRWVEEYSNDPGIVQRVRHELKEIGAGK
jgi:hypothetical protein